MIRLEDVLKMSWRRFSRRLEEFWRRLEDVLKPSSKRLEDVLKISWRRLEDVRLTRTYSSWSRRLESSRRLLKTKTKDVFIKANVCWVIAEFLRVNSNFSRIRIFMQVFLKPSVYSEKNVLSMRSQVTLDLMRKQFTMLLFPYVWKWMW